MVSLTSKIKLSLIAVWKHGAPSPSSDVGKGVMTSVNMDSSHPLHHEHFHPLNHFTV
jgi:hypothetical protein